MRRLAFMMAALLLFSAAVSAQSVDDLIAKNVAAKGGVAKLKSINSLRITGTVEFGGTQATVVELEKRPSKMRTEISLQGLTMVQGYDGKTGWQIIPFSGKKDPEAVGGDELKQLEEEADIDGPLIDYKTKGNKVELVGKEKVEGTDAYNLRVTLRNGNVRNVYLDADSFLEIKVVGKTIVRGTETTSSTTLGDYKQVDGVMFPFSVQITQEGGQGGAQKITVEKVEFNVPADDASFKMPAVAPAASTPKETTDPKAPGQTVPKPDSASKPPLF